MAANLRYRSADRQMAVGIAVARYRQGERADLIAASLGITKSAFNYHVRKAGVPKRNDGTVPWLPCLECGTLFQTPNFKRRKKCCSSECRQRFVSRTRTIQGETHGGRDYLLGVIPDGHPRKPERTGGRVLRRRAVHVIAAEKALGRALRRGEVVHHINGDKRDNRNSNLLICSQSYHAALHQRMSALYQREHFARMS